MNELVSAAIPYLRLRWRSGIGAKPHGGCKQDLAPDKPPERTSAACRPLGALWVPDDDVMETTTSDETITNDDRVETAISDDREGTVVSTSGIGFEMVVEWRSVRG